MPGKVPSKKCTLLEGVMLKFCGTAGIGIAAILLIALHAELAKSAPHAAGAPHIGGAPHFGGAISHFGTAPHFSTAPHISYHPTISRPAVHPSFGGNNGTTLGLKNPAFPVGAPAGSAGDETATVPSPGTISQTPGFPERTQEARAAVGLQQTSELVKPSSTTTRHYRRHVGHNGRIASIMRHWLSIVR
jgi:hypothetical protein